MCSGDIKASLRIAAEKSIHITSSTEQMIRHILLDCLMFRQVHKSGIETLQINGQNGNEIVMIIAITCAKLKNPTGPSHAMRVLAERCYKVSIDVRASARNKKAKRGGT